MAYVAMIGLLFVPLVLLLFCGWNFVKYYSETENSKKMLYQKKAKTFLLAAVIAAAVFGVLKIFFPF
ncbi:MAG: hypothetical protein VB023_01375 [Oscillibacter sp.]|nr:hypothetical protein [Oscillibacter sp.]